MQRPRKKHYDYDALMRYARLLGFGGIQVKLDPVSGLHAIIAVHSTKRGPAIGGCRFKSYHSFGHALKDVLRLSYMMTLKASACDLPHGGAKAVIIKPSHPINRQLLFHRFADFVDSLNGRYITAMDIGTSTDDMNLIAERTAHVIGATALDPLHGDPSPYTALGVMKGMQAAVKFKWNRHDLAGLHVAIQGGGKVGYALAKLLHAAGATLTVTDRKGKNLQHFVDQFGANVVDGDAIFDIPCDIFAPCAVGSVINMSTIHRLQTSIIAGSANNQLAHHKCGWILKQRDILYVPDFVINAGGLIQAACVHDYADLTLADQKIEQLYQRLLQLFERASREDKPTLEVAQLDALEKLQDY